MDFESDVSLQKNKWSSWKEKLRFMAEQGSAAREAGKELSEGCTVKITGLKGAPQHNGAFCQRIATPALRWSAARECSPLQTLRT